MAYSRSTLFPLFIVIMLSLALAANAGRPAPATAATNKTAHDKKQTECIDQEGTVLIPGVGRYTIGSHDLPSVSGLDHSVPAATHAQYLPGNDDTFVPNPGYEVPNPFGGAGSTP